MNIQCKGISHHYHQTTALDQIQLEIISGELIALLGPSGCGKTTLLRLIAGLLPIQEGKLFYNENDITKWTPQKRNTAMVFQSYALFPHMTVYENIAYGLAVRNHNKKEIEAKVHTYLQKVHLEGLENRKVQALSGGQQQRVALARALILNPDVLLFDEPLSNLDEKLRIQMRREIRALQKESGITTIYVTHDQEEAMAIADRIVVMDKGQLQQIGTPHDVYHRPQNRFVANFMGVCNMIELNGEQRMIRPENIHVHDHGQHRGCILWIEPLGSIQQMGIRTEWGDLTAVQFSHQVQRDASMPTREVSFDIVGDGIRI